MTKSVDAKDKSLREILSGSQYLIDFYQREYKWQRKQVGELIDDLTNRFLTSFSAAHVRGDVAEYPAYFLGSVVLSRKSSGTYIVDGQQRLTSLTLLLIHLRNLQLAEAQAEDPNIQSLIVSTQYGQKSLNLNVPERADIMNALFLGETIGDDFRDSSSLAIAERYAEIEELFPEECKGEVLPFFMDWLLEKVQLVEISAYSDEDAYTIFETMNDRGLSLNPADMLKGYVLSNIREAGGRGDAEVTWRESVPPLEAFGKDAVNDFFRSWFRGRFAQTAGTSGDDFERLGPEFHRWLRDNADSVGLKHSEEFLDFVKFQLPWYSRWYAHMRSGGASFSAADEILYYVAEMKVDHGVLMMSVVDPLDPPEITQAKLRVVARFLDIFINRRVWASKNVTKPGLKGSFLSLARALRPLSLEELTARLYAELVKPGHDNFEGPPPLLTNAAKRKVHRFLARLTSYVELEAGSGEYLYPQLVVVSGRSRFDIEHVWPNRFDYVRDQFDSESEFMQFRNRLGGLVLLPHSYNASYQDMEPSVKIPLYSRPDHNLLCASLASATYSNNPRFRQWVSNTKFGFKPYDSIPTGFSRQAIEERTDLYRQLARAIWSPELLLSASGLGIDELIPMIENYQGQLGEEGDDDRSAGTRVDFNISVQDLIAEGLVRIGDVLVGRRDGASLVARGRICAAGVIELDNGGRFQFLSPAAMALFDNQMVVNGWDFWTHEASGLTMSALREQLYRGDDGLTAVRP